MSSQSLHLSESLRFLILKVLVSQTRADNYETELNWCMQIIRAPAALSLRSNSRVSVAHLYDLEYLCPSLIVFRLYSEESEASERGQIVSDVAEGRVRPTCYTAECRTVLLLQPS